MYIRRNSSTPSEFTTVGSATSQDQSPGLVGQKHDGSLACAAPSVSRHQVVASSNLLALPGRSSTNDPCTARVTTLGPRTVIRTNKRKEAGRAYPRSRLTDNRAL